MDYWTQNEQKISLIQGDITTQVVDAIVNAANSQLAGGGGVDGAIHRRGGPTIMQETRERYPNGCPTGSAVISSAGHLSAKYVFHAVGPIWQGGQAGEPELLRAAYRRCLDLARSNECRTIAFPSLSTGAYGYPMSEASRIALSSCIAYFQEYDSPSEILFVLFDEMALEIFRGALQTLVNNDSD